MGGRQRRHHRFGPPPGLFFLQVQFAGGGEHRRAVGPEEQVQKNFPPGLGVHPQLAGKGLRLAPVARLPVKVLGPAHVQRHLPDEQRPEQQRLLPGKAQVGEGQGKEGVLSLAPGRGPLFVKGEGVFQKVRLHGLHVLIAGEDGPGGAAQPGRQTAGVHRVKTLAAGDVQRRR